MIEKTGDLFTTTAPAVGHGVNVYGVMGAGIALQFAKRWPAMEAEYKNQCMATFLNPGEVFVYDTPEYVIFNMASQMRPGADASIEWLTSAAMKAGEAASQRGIDVIAIPKIGCGIGGLTWEEVKPALESVEEETGVEFEVWTFEA